MFGANSFSFFFFWKCEQKGAKLSFVKRMDPTTCHESFAVIRGSVALSKRVSTGDTYQRALHDNDGLANISTTETFVCYYEPHNNLIGSSIEIATRRVHSHVGSHAQAPKTSSTGVCHGPQRDRILRWWARI